MRFYLGLHIPSHANEFDNTFISISTLKSRKSDIHPRTWILDSAAFTQIEKHGEFQMSIPDYVKQCNRWRSCGNMVAAVSQDYMCEPFILKKWNRSVNDHQKMTVDRYYKIIDENPTPYILPVLQGYSEEDYLKCADMYDFKPGRYVGVGSVCKRNSNASTIAGIITAIKNYTGFELHGFGIKKTSLLDPVVRGCLKSSDSMAWSFAARAETNFTWPNRANDWTYARDWYREIRSIEGVT